MKLTRYNSFSIFFYVFAVFSLVTCTLNNENKQDYEHWTSADPLAIHHRVREQKYLQGNLLTNNSFESGKLIEFDSVTHTTKIDGWDLIGKDVVWIHPGSDSILADRTEVHDGVCSIRIIRNSASETEEYGEGVLSNFIKVIPGNYQLSLFIKLQNVENLKSRLGTRLYDAIDIKLISYDRNKIQISGDFYAPYYNTSIDNSFKGLSFANYTSIDSTGWIHILGRSHLFPFPEGDLQDETKFVRIFIGLKGIGSMWIDDVQFNYTRWNFTQLERLSPYLDTTLAKSKLITPQPRRVDILESIIYYRPYYRDLLPVVLVPELADGLTMQAAKLLESRIKEMLINLTDIQGKDIPGLIKTRDSFRQNEASVIFSIGLTEEMKKNVENLPLESIQGKKKGFMIQTLDIAGHIIFLYGNTPEANYYAVQTALQLFDNKRLLFHNADIIDYPADRDFGLLLLDASDSTIDFLKANNETRFGSVYLPLKDANVYKIFNNDLRFTTFSKWLYTSYSSDVFKNKDFGKITGALNGVALLYNDIPTEITIDAIIENFNAKQSNLKNEDLTDLSNLIREAKVHNLDLELMPPFTNNRSLNKMIFDPAYSFESNLSMNYNLPLIWSGYQYQSWQLDEADLMYFKLFTQEPVVFFDYTLLLRSETLGYFANDSVYPYKLLASSLFEPFSNEVLPEVYQGVTKTVVVYKYSNVFDRIRLQTASDFFWNPDNYDPDLSLFRALVSEFGDENARILLYYNDYYFKIRSDILLARIQKNPHKYQRRIAAYLKEIHTLQNQLEENPIARSHQELLQVINHLTKDLERQLENSSLLISTN